MRRTIFDEDHDLFRQSVRQWVEAEMVPHHADWEKAGIVPKSVFRRAGELGFLGMAVPEEYGGGGVDDFRFNAVMSEEFARAGVASSGLGIMLHNDTCLPYFLEGATEEQRGYVLQKDFIGHCWQDGFLAEQQVAPKSMIA